MNTSKIALTCMLVCFGTYGIAAGESKLDMVYKRPTAATDNKSSSQTPPSSKQLQVPASRCAVVVAPPNDLRKNKETLGTAAGDNSITTNQNPTIWLEAALLDLKGQGFDVVSSRTQGISSPLPILSLKTDIDKIYVWFHSMNIHATLVVTAKITDGSGETIEKKYRANGTKLNWWSANGEFVDTLNYAAGDLLEKMAVDLNKMCRV